MNELELLHQAVITCERCPRLRSYCTGIAATRVRRFHDWEYWGKPVPGFGDPHARLLILGLAPAAHGANRTGRMFTGDNSGNWLYEAMHRYGFATQPTSVHREDGLELTGAYITAAGRCAPPDNKPAPDELTACRPFLHQELAVLKEVKVVLVLGKIAFDSYLKVLKEQGVNPGKLTFGHGALYRFDDPSLPILLCSYHPSNQNTQTGRLTREMWHAIFAAAQALIN